MENDSCQKDESCRTCDMAKRCNEKTQEEHEDRLLNDALSVIKHKIFVLSGKGGVGKSTFSVNLAVSLAAQGYKTGLLDIDIHGPNVPKMLGLDGWTLSQDVKSGKIAPFRPFPMLKVVSMAGMLPNDDSPVIWRGPLKMLAIRQFLSDVSWGALDFLIVDSPPGTGDEPLSIVQLIPDADGAVIITTPQEVSLLDARKSVAFARKLKLPILGLVENMSGLRCPHCGDIIPLFSQGGGRKASEELEIPFLGSLPISPTMPEHCDKGKPYVLQEKSDELIEAFEGIRTRLMASLKES